MTKNTFIVLCTKYIFVELNHICSGNPQFFWIIFEQIKYQKQNFFFSNMPCFSKIVSTNGNGFQLKSHGFPLQEVFTNGKLVYLESRF
jgi:hypothetical protein